MQVSLSVVNPMAELWLDGHLLDVRQGEGLARRPRFLVGDGVVAVGPYLDRDERERNILRTVGSADYFSADEVDEIRFNRESGVLESLAFRVPEHALELDLSDEWDALDEVEGLPRLVVAEDFQVTPCDRRFFSRAGDLICVRLSSLEALSNSGKFESLAVCLFSLTTLVMSVGV